MSNQDIGFLLHKHSCCFEKITQRMFRKDAVSIKINFELAYERYPTHVYVHACACVHTHTFPPLFATIRIEKVCAGISSYLPRSQIPNTYNKNIDTLETEDLLLFLCFR